MLALAARLGYSESAFLSPGRSRATTTCATSAPWPRCRSAATRRSRPGSRWPSTRGAAGRLVLHTASGEVPVDTETGEGGRTVATLTSVAPYVEEPDPALRDRRPRAPALGSGRARPRRCRRGWRTPAARHLILACRTRERLADLDYDFDALKTLMLDHDLTTVALVWREDPRVFHARDPFPVGGVVEDPATGAAAAAFGAYLRELGAVTPPVDLTIHQGEDMGRPSTLDGARGHRPTGRSCASAGRPWRSRAQGLAHERLEHPAGGGRGAVRRARRRGGVADAEAHGHVGQLARVARGVRPASAPAARSTAGRWRRRTAARPGSSAAAAARRRPRPR